MAVSVRDRQKALLVQFVLQAEAVSKPIFPLCNSNRYSPQVVSRAIFPRYKKLLLSLRKTKTHHSHTRDDSAHARRNTHLSTTLVHDRASITCFDRFAPFTAIRVLAQMCLCGVLTVSKDTLEQLDLSCFVCCTSCCA